MEFRLTYAGQLLSTGNDSGSQGAFRRTDHKHDIRKVFHQQLKRLWDVTPLLKNGQDSGPFVWLGATSPDPPSLNPRHLKNKHEVSGWGFVPLVTTQLNLVCALDVLFLRPDRPGAVMNSGDLDGRIKTLLDALAKPDANQGYDSRKKTPGDDPLYVLLEDDKLVTKLTVETDQMLEPVDVGHQTNDVRLVITVRLRPYEMHLGNLAFG